MTTPLRAPLAIFLLLSCAAGAGCGSKKAGQGSLPDDGAVDSPDGAQPVDDRAIDRAIVQDAAPVVVDAAASEVPQNDAAVLPAFPGAEGFGARARGGRGGDVYHVTSLDDAGAGTLREGLTSAVGPRTIVFDVSGTIVLLSPLIVNNKTSLTIAGQTAPGGGITLRDHSFNLKNARHVVVRYLRFRRGDVKVREAGMPTSSAGLDATSIDDSSDVIFDHVSLSWSCDELLGIVQNRNVTIQWSLLAEPLGDPVLHPYGENHAYGLNNSANTLSFHHSLVANYVMRGPQFEANDATTTQGYDVFMEAVNNVLFGYERSGARYTTGIETDPPAAAGVAFRFHFVNNMYIRDPARATAPEIHAVVKHGVIDQVKVHVAGNIGPSRPTDDLDPWLSVRVEGGVGIRQAAADVQAQMSDRPLFSSPDPVTLHSATAAHDLVLRHAGHSLVRDDVDKRIIADVTQRRFADPVRSQDQVGGWPIIDSVSRPATWDSDRDGMPDAWELTAGLDPTNGADGNGDSDSDGYTNLEEFLNELAGPVPGH